MSLNRLIIKTKGNKKTGYGHFYRCLAIAERLKNKVKCIFLTDDFQEFNQLLDTCEFNDIEVIKRDYSDETSQLYNLKKQVDTILIDDYDINQTQITELKNIGFKTIYIDDLLLDFTSIDCLINHNQKHSEADYSGNAEKYFIGFDYLLLRKQFLNEAKEEYKPQNNNEVFIAAGGTDYYSVSRSIIEQTLLNKNISKVNVLIKAPIADFEENPRVIFHSNLNTANLISLIKKCNIAITSASTLALECLCIGTNLILFTIAENQKELNTFLVENALASSIGDWDSSKEKLPKHLEKAITNNHTAINQKKYLNQFDFNKLESIFS